MTLPPAKGWQFNLGGVNVAFETATCGLALASSPRYTGFSGTASPDLILRVKNGAPPMPSGAPTFEAGHWDYYCHDAVDMFRMRIASPGPHFTIYTAVLQADGRRGELYIEDENPASGEHFSYEIPPLALDEILANHWIARHGGLILHACGLASTSGVGLLFSGHSGAGKSTTARLWLQSGQAQLLSDERIRIFRGENSYYIQGTPWHGEGLTPSCATVPLQRIFIITHAPQNKAHIINPSQAMQALLSRAMLPFWDEKGLGLALDFLNNLCRSVPCYALGFVPDQSVVEYVQCLNE